MLQKTRALRRASDAAAARATVTARTPLLILGTAAAALVGITLTVGIAPAAGAERPDAASAVTSQAFGAEPLTRMADKAVMTVSAGEDAVAAADALTAEVAASGLDVSAAAPVDTAQLEDDLDTLSDRSTLPLLLVTVTAEQAAAETEEVVSATATLQQAFTAAQEQKAAEEAAAEAARVAAEQAAAAAAALASANTVDGAKATAQQMMADRYGWGGDQFSCLNSLWNKESGWNYKAYNPSGATGIPQALPGSKMASAGSDWQSNAATQIAWGLGYIADVYGTPCSAWGHSQAVNWY
ncbi:phospholipase [Microbacterium sp. p3-SID336]|uniref:aggregation-promoting factor C-terminal-like domain-containing protein n=1 Tax=Microbacterium sp. p3-SID336 TaxID=2916212 RepID=UPI0021A3281C|nr:phospholipase [Microbacterium sp. p3-SID336]MCT1478512.1 phospholipase [Microbacterium sp. p3-SID336]